MCNMKNETRITQTGCYLDNHRGHYIMRDVIALAHGFGFILAPGDQFVVDMYDSSYELPVGVEYPFETLHELCDDAIQWLNDAPGEQQPGQNPSPDAPDGYLWGWNDGDFGLYSPTEDERVEDTDDEHDECPDCGNVGVKMTPEGYKPCVRYLSCWAD